MSSNQPDDAAAGFKLIRTIAKDDAGITQLAWSPDGNLLAASSKDRNVKLWDWTAGDLRFTTIHEAEVNCVTWSPDGMWIAAGDAGGGIYLWDVENKVLAGAFDVSKSVESIAWSPDGKWLAYSLTHESVISLWGIEAGKIVPKKDVSLNDEHGRWFLSIVWGEDSTLLASAGDDGSVTLWNVQARKVLRRFKAHYSAVNSVTFSPDKRIVASGSDDTTIQVREDEPGRVFDLTGHEHPVTCVSFSWNGRLLASISNDGTIKLWRYGSLGPTWELIASLKEPRKPFQPFYGTQLAFHPRLSILAALGQNDTLIRIWELDYDLLFSIPPSALPRAEVRQGQGEKPALTFVGPTITDSPYFTINASDTEATTPPPQTSDAEPTRTIETTTPVEATPITDATPPAEPRPQGESVSTDAVVEQPKEGDEAEERAEEKLEQQQTPAPPKTPEPAPKQEPEPETEPEPEEERFFAATSGDQPTSEDSIGFTPYVNAIAEFLSNDKTKAPLTLSIEGEWGSGKSSFMLQLENELLKRVLPRKRRMLWSLRREMRIRRERIPTPLRRLKSFQLRLFKGKIKFPRVKIKFFQRLLVPKEVRKISCPTVRFNAWRHDKEDALWASFAIAFIRKLSQGLSPLARPAAHFKLLFRRFRWSDGLPVLLRVVTVGAVLILTTVALIMFLFSGGVESLAAKSDGKVDPDGAFVQLVKGSGVVGYIALFFFLVNKFRDFIGNPFSVDLRRYVEAPDYRSHVAFIENFHEDFRRIVDTYAGENKVFIFIDDLDRCEVPKAADLMQALNLLISDSPQLVFIIGMDREKVAAGLAVKYEKLLPYLAPPATDGEGKASTLTAPAFDSTGGLEYGYSYIEKFIQLPFRIPQPDDTELRRLLDAISPSTTKAARKDSTVRTASDAAPAREDVRVGGDAGGGDGAPGRVVLYNRVLTTEPSGGAPTGVVSGPVQGAGTAWSGIRMVAAQAAGRDARSVAETVDGDSPAVREIVLMVAAAFENNPRRIKQFINSFRLKAYIVGNLGLLVPYGKPPAGERMTLQQLGKFVAISLRWPRLLADLDDDRDLLAKLQRLALGAKVAAQANGAPLAVSPEAAATPYFWQGLDVGEMTPAERRNRVVEHWSARQPLLELLKRDCDDPEKRKLCTLTTLKVDNLLKISPKLGTPTVPQSKAEVEATAQTKGTGRA